jgi:rhamnose utilization protein RhaD (predicted bifunctional aldolase and dehydrogenase)
MTTIMTTQLANKDALRDELVQLSKALGNEARQLAILGEGNTSVNCGDGTFWVKASGSSLGTLDASGLTRVSFDKILSLLNNTSMSEQEIEDALVSSRVDDTHKKPSVETFLHALCLSEGGATWIGHTHSVAINQILCSAQGATPFLQHIFPDAIVVCGAVPAVVTYHDPGFGLAKAISDELRRYRGVHGKPPKLLLMENHGPVALGQTAKEVFNIMLMADKWARILAGTFALGGPKYLPQSEVSRIDNRLDEIHRRRELLKG